MSVTRSRPKSVSHGSYHGPVPRKLWDILRVSWEQGLAVQSNYAREHASEVALAASMGFISTVSLDGRKYQRVWNVTHEGVVAFTNRENY